MLSSRPQTFRSWSAGSSVTGRDSSLKAKSCKRCASRGSPHLVSASFNTQTSSVGDILFFPPRVIAGLAEETLRSAQPPRFPQNLEELSRATSLWAQRGKIVEAETFDTVSAMLPLQAQGFLQVFRPDTSTIAARDNQSPAIDVAAYASPATQNTSDLYTQQVAAELASVQTSVTRINETAQALLAATDAAEVPLLQLNLREARGTLQKRMEQLSNSSASDISCQAVDDANLLLSDLDTMV